MVSCNDASLHKVIPIPSLGQHLIITHLIGLLGHLLYTLAANQYCTLIFHDLIPSLTVVPKSQPHMSTLWIVSKSHASSSSLLLKKWKVPYQFILEAYYQMLYILFLSILRNKLFYFYQATWELNNSLLIVKTWGAVETSILVGILGNPSQWWNFSASAVDCQFHPVQEKTTLWVHHWKK